MAGSLWKTIVDDGPPIYYNNEFRIMLEKHLNWLLGRPKTQVVPIKPNMAIRNDYDFYGVLRELKIAPQFHWIVLRMNGYTNPMEYRSERLSVVVPDTADLDQLRTTFTTVHRIS